MVDVCLEKNVINSKPDAESTPHGCIEYNNNNYCDIGHKQSFYFTSALGTIAVDSKLMITPAQKL